MIFFYYGENSFLALEKIQAIKDKFKEKVDKNAQNIEVLDGELLKPEDFFRAVSAMGFLAPKKLIVVKNLLNNKKLGAFQDAIIKFLDNHKDEVTENYIVFFESSRPDARGKLYKRLKKFKFVEEFPPLSSVGLTRWLKQAAAKHQKTLTPEASRLLINYVGNNLWQLHQEINKLVNYVSKEEIDETAVRALVQAKTDDSIFALIDAIGTRDKAMALKLIEDKINIGLNHQYILTMVVRQFRLIIKTKALGKQITNASALAQTLKIHPLVAEKALKQSQLYDLDSLKNIYQELLTLDEKFKSSSNQEKILLDNMIRAI